jgi:hypothetical protein
VSESFDLSELAVNPWDEIAAQIRKGGQAPRAQIVHLLRWGKGAIPEEVQAYLAAWLTGEIRQTAGRPASNLNSEAWLIWDIGRWYRGYRGRGVSDPMRRTISKLAERQGKTFETMERQYRRSKARLREWRRSQKSNRWDGEDAPLIMLALTEIDRKFRHLR